MASKVHWRGGCGKPAWGSAHHLPASQLLKSPQKGQPAPGASWRPLPPQAPDTYPDLNVTQTPPAKLNTALLLCLWSLRPFHLWPADLSRCSPSPANASVPPPASTCTPKGQGWVCVFMHSFIHSFIPEVPCSAPGATDPSLGTLSLVGKARPEKRASARGEAKIPMLLSEGSSLGARPAAHFPKRLSLSHAPVHTLPLLFPH